MNAPKSPTVIKADFKPAWWLPNHHMQTLWPVLFRRPPLTAIRRERLELPDGDFVDLDWTTGTSGPLVLLLHGLEGSLRSKYARGLLARLHNLGWRGVLMNFRGCSGEPNRQARAYHSGDTADLEFVIDTLRARETDPRLAAVGFSLGANVLLKWLGESGARSRLDAAVAVSVPFQLGITTRNLEAGFRRVYQDHLLKRLKRSMARKLDTHPEQVDAATLGRVSSIWEFDQHITAPLHGFAGADDYYARSSCHQYLAGIDTPTLIIQARDDSFVPADLVPRAAELAPKVRLELSPHGGHVGFVSGNWPLRGRYWLEERIPDYIRGFLET